MNGLEDDLYLAVLYNYSYRPYEIKDINQWINKNTLRYTLELEHVTNNNNSRKMVATLNLVKRTSNIYTVELTKGVRKTSIMVGQIERISGCWQSNFSRTCFSGLTSRGTPGGELWRIIVATW